MIGALGLHPAKGPLSVALRAAFGGCALHRPAGLVTRGLSKIYLIFDWGREPIDTFSPSVRPYGLPPPSQREAFGALPRQYINWPGGGA